MFKFATTFLLFLTLNSIAQGEDRCCADTQNSLEDVKSDVEDIKDLIESLSAKLEQKFKCQPSKTVFCPRGFTYLPLAESCYKVVHESHDWTSAAETCQKLGRGSRLVAITSEAESNALKTFLTSEITKNAGSTACVASDWTGLGSFFWTSGQRKIEGDCKYPFIWKLFNEKQLPFGFTNWLPGEPSCGGNTENCMHLWATKNFGWNDAQCSVKICPLCEYNP